MTQQIPDQSSIYYLSRRDFFRRYILGGLGTIASLMFPPWVIADIHSLKQTTSTTDVSLHEARYWDSLPDGKIQCKLCPNGCVLSNNELSRCHARMPKNNKLYTLGYGKLCVLVEDPLAKNPLFHVAPGANAIGCATAGCNLTCSYCQNWEFSQTSPLKTRNINLTPAELVQKTMERKLKWITFSYTEPVVYYEYLIDTARIAHENGVKIAVATAGSICPEPLQELIKHTDAFSVTLKGYSEEFYQQVCGCKLKDVHATIKTIAQSGVWLEIATLIVPGMNDAPEGIKSIARFIAEINPKIPLHFLRFYPAYKLRNLQPTPLLTLERAHAIATAEKLQYVYIDLPGHQASATYCPKCKHLLVERAGFTILKNLLRNKKCPQCSYPVPGLW